MYFQNRMQTGTADDMNDLHNKQVFEAQARLHIANM